MPINEYSITGDRTDRFRCLGDFDPHNKFCLRSCALSLRCLITLNRNLRREECMDLFEFEDIEPAMMQ